MDQAAPGSGGIQARHVMTPARMRESAAVMLVVGVMMLASIALYVALGIPLGVGK